MILVNPSIQDGNVHSRLRLLKFFHKGLDRFKTFHVDFHHLNLSRLKLAHNLPSSGFTLPYVPHPKNQPRLMFRVESGGLETYPGVGTGDKNRLTGEVDICWDLWDRRRKLFEAERDRSV